MNNSVKSKNNLDDTEFVESLVDIDNFIKEIYEESEKMAEKITHTIEKFTQLKGVILAIFFVVGLYKDLFDNCNYTKILDSSLLFIACAYLLISLIRHVMK